MNHPVFYFLFLLQELYSISSSTVLLSVPQLVKMWIYLTHWLVSIGKVHPHERFYFGLPIQVCLPQYEVESVAAFIPVTRIDSVCVVAELSYNLRTPNGKEKIVVAVPLDLKLHVWILEENEFTQVYVSWLALQGCPTFRESDSIWFYQWRFAM